MSDALFLAAVTGAVVGDVVSVDGDEGHHAAVVKRTQAGERVIVADGEGFAVAGPTVEVSKKGLRVQVDEVLSGVEPPLRVTVVQALPKADRGELAVQAMTELGVARIVPWAASRCITKWSAERAPKLHGKWVATAREATKQSRRFRVPEVTELHATADVVALLSGAKAFILHEDVDVASRPLAVAEVAAGDDVILVVGPEGGLSPEEVDRFVDAGGALASLGEGVLRTSTAGVVALAQLRAIVEAARG